MKINEGITLNRKLLDKTLSYSPWDSSSGRKRAEFAMFLTVCKSHTCMKHVVISIKSLHDLRQITLSSASNHAPICIKKRAVLRQVAIVLSYSCIVISPFRSSFPIFFAFYFPVSCFSIPVFFRCFLTKYVLKFSLSYYQMSLISSIIFLDILGYRLRQGELKCKKKHS